jgi:hypothetical protein
MESSCLPSVEEINIDTSAVEGKGDTIGISL